MRSRNHVLLALLCNLGFGVGLYAQTPLGTSFTYQGRLDLAGTPVTDTVDFRFSLWDAVTAGNLVASSPQVNGVTVTDGLFTVAVDFGAGAFNGTARWIEIEVASPSGGVFETLTPRQPLTAAPLAHGLPAIRNIDRNEGFAVGSWNIVGGARFNTVDPLAAGVTISGGGRQFGANVAYDNFSVIGGGDGHLTGTDNGDPDDAAFATIGGGSFNIASGNYSTVAGGVGNQATGFLSFIGGGEDNVASGDDATVPGGQQNAAAGANSFAAGRRAKANHDGSFVWGDSTNANFSSTGNNQFLIRAAGGVGIGTSAPKKQLHNAGDYYGKGHVWLYANEGDGSSGTAYLQARDDSGASNIALQLRTQQAGSIVDAARVTSDGKVGIGTTNPQAKLDVSGDIAATGAIRAGGALNAASAQFSGDVITPSVRSGDGTGLQLQSLNSTLDQSFESTCCYGTPSDVWQSFTAGMNGNLGAIEVHRYEGAASASVYIYQGEGTGGALLATMSIPATSAWVWQRASVPVTVPVVSGSVYTIRVSASGTNNWVFQAGGTDYPGGRASESAGMDFGFRTYVVTGSPTATIHDKGLGVGRVASANALEVEGNASKSAAGSWLANSDRRIKKNIETVTDALDTLDKVRLVSFEYTDDYQRTHAGVGDGRYLNVIAQEFAEIFPDHVKGSGERLQDGSEILQVDTYPLTIYSAAAIQELRAEKDAEISALREANTELTERLAILEALVGKLTGK